MFIFTFLILHIHVQNQSFNKTTDTSNLTAVMLGMIMLSPDLRMVISGKRPRAHEASCLILNLNSIKANQVALQMSKTLTK